MNNKLLLWLSKYSNSKEYDSEEEDFEEFLKEYKKRKDKIKDIYHSKNNEESKQIPLLFLNSYGQRKMVDANKNLVIATWILALATIIFTISHVWGATAASNIIDIGFKILLVLSFVVFIGLILRLVNRWIKKIIKSILLKRPHIWCYKCGRIIIEYEKKGHKNPAFTTCPDCRDKIGAI